MKMPQNPALDPLVGATLGRYTIQSRIGAGGMGAVYRAEQRPLGRAVALKVIHADLALDRRVAGRFMREARIACQLTNPHTVTIFDFGNEGEQLYLAMELLKGESLQSRLSRGPIEPVRAAEIAAQVCRSLSEAHRNRIIHRDLKPDNIFLCSADDASLLVKVLDYGLARIVASDEAPHSTLGTLTQAGSIVGTPAYMSPEQARSRPLDVRADLYSMGVVLFEMLTGVPPFDDRDAILLLGKHLRDPPPRLSSVGAKREAPEAMQVLIDKLLEKEPARRPPDAAWVYQELRAYQRNQPGWDDRVGLPARETIEQGPTSPVLHLRPLTPPEPTEPAPFQAKARPITTPADPQTEPWSGPPPELYPGAGPRGRDSSGDRSLSDAETDRAPQQASFAAGQDSRSASRPRTLEASEPHGPRDSDAPARTAPSALPLAQASWQANLRTPRIVALALVCVCIAIGATLVVRGRRVTSATSRTRVVRPRPRPAREQGVLEVSHSTRRGVLPVSAGAGEGRSALDPPRASEGEDAGALVSMTPARWSGVWTSNRGTVVLRQLRSEVTGTMGRAGRIVGQVHDKELRLRWSTRRQTGQAVVGCYRNPEGRLELRGTWGVRESDRDGGDWMGAFFPEPRTTAGRRQPGRRTLVVPSDEIFGARGTRVP